MDADADVRMDGVVNVVMAVVDAPAQEPPTETPTAVFARDLSDGG